MNIVNSEDWNSLVSLKNKPNILINSLLYLKEETRKYELGEAYYPKVDYAISISIDEEKNKIIDLQVLELPELVETNETRKAKIRESWDIKYNISSNNIEKLSEIKKPIKRRGRKTINN